jgi:two-component system, OmpR family, phosphate regulon sensor histidine kinase PhoR
VRRGQTWNWWLAPLACITLAGGFAFASNITVGLAIAALGFFGHSWLRTRQLRELLDVDGRSEFDAPMEEPMRSAHQRWIALQSEREALAHQVRSMRDSWDLIPSSVVELDQAQRVMWANAAARRDFGIDRNQHAGVPLSLVVHSSVLMSGLLDHSQAPIELTSPLDDTRELRLQAMRTPQSGWLLAASDVTDAKNVERMRRDFIANVAHELKTPLTVLAGFSETLESFDELSDAERAELVGHMQQQTRAMQRLVSDLLSLSRLETEMDSAPHDPVPVRALAQRCLQAALLAVPGHAPDRIVVEVSPTAVVLGASNDLESALINLLVNALRYTPAATPIEVRFVANAHGAALSVRDEGQGIDAEHLPRLTQRFYRVDRGRSRSAGGTGLGLAIVKHILAKHEGELLIESVVGKGSVFTLQFPPSRIVQT